MLFWLGWPGYLFLLWLIGSSANSSYWMSAYCRATAPSGFLTGFQRVGIGLNAGRLQVAWGEASEATEGVRIDTDAPGFGVGGNYLDGASLWSWEAETNEFGVSGKKHRIRVRLHRISMPTWPFVTAYVLVWALLITWRWRRVVKLSTFEPAETS